MPRSKKPLIDMPTTKEDEKKARCMSCGTFYDKARGNFPASVQSQYAGLGYIPICNRCLNNMYSKFLVEIGDPAHAMRQVCRVLNTHWSSSVYKSAITGDPDKPMVNRYLGKLRSTAVMNLLSYSDTLEKEGLLWEFAAHALPEEKEEEVHEIPDKWILMWGRDLDYQTYLDLNQKYENYISKYPNDTEIPVGDEALVRQICQLEVEVSKAAASGKSIEKSVNALNTALSSLNWTPKSKKDTGTDFTKNPLGVWIQKYENERPLPEIDENLRDVDKLKHYIDVYFRGHMCKSLGIKNEFAQAYEEEMEKYEVHRPEYFDDEDDQSFSDFFKSE